MSALRQEEAERPGGRRWVGGPLGRALKVERRELRALAWAFLGFFSVLSGYYVIRPIREEMGVQGGVRNLHWLFTATFVCMLVAVPLYSALVARVARREFVPFVYLFFGLNLVGFWLLFDGLGALPPLGACPEVRAWCARGFFVWVSVYNLFVVSVFWSLLADLFTTEQSKRLFGFIAAGGTLGGLLGSGAATLLVGVTGVANLIWITLVLLFLAAYCTRRLSSETDFRAEEDEPGAARGHEPAVIGGGVFEGFRHVARSPYLLGICGYMFVATLAGTFLYFQQATIVARAFDSDVARTRVFSSMDFAVQAGTLGIQLFFTARIIARFGLALTLGLLPAVFLAGFLSLGLATVLGVLVVFQVTRRIANFALAKPTKEILFTVVPRTDKYKAKSFIDTVVYRGGDAASGWLFEGLRTVGLSLAGIAFVAAPVCALWIGLAGWLARRERALEASAAASAEARPGS